MTTWTPNNTTHELLYIIFPRKKRQSTWYMRIILYSMNKKGRVDLYCSGELISSGISAFHAIKVDRLNKIQNGKQKYINENAMPVDFFLAYMLVDNFTARSSCFQFWDIWIPICYMHAWYIKLRCRFIRIKHEYAGRIS